MGRILATAVPARRVGAVTMTLAVHPDAAVHVVARTPNGRCLLPNQQFTALVRGRRIPTYRQRFTYPGSMRTDDDGRAWIHATRNNHTEWVALDAVIRIHRRAL
jgi:hypothetical protein